jgi:Leishmanolysin
MTNSRILLAVACIATSITFAACHDSSGPKPPGPPASITVVSGGGQTAPANTAIAAPISVVVKDANGTALPNKQLTVNVIAGGGAIGVTTVTTDANGVATLPSWTLGKMALPQTVRFQIDTVKGDVSATVQTLFNIEVRFWGQAMTADQKALFTNAAGRIEGVVTGDIPDAQASNIDLNSSCGVSGQPTMTEVIDDVIIYASIQPIDGPGKILAQSGPCLVRNSTATEPEFPAVGVMEFDSADLAAISGNGSLQDVITHEMLHVLGFGVIWQDDSLLVGAGSSNPRFTGAQAVAGCVAVGGSSICVSSVPVEGNSAPAGTADSHWRESTFNAELMTGYIDATNPFSKMTIGSLGDLGYVVNNADFDVYAVGAALRAAGSSQMGIQRRDWERLRKPAFALDPATGRARPLRLK